MPTAAPHLLLIAHAPLASALRACALHVFAESADFVHALDVPADEAPEATLERAQALLEMAASSGSDAPMLVLSDVLGATPCNVAQRLVEGTPHRLLAGVNVPMLLRAVAYRHEPLDNWVQRALTGGQQGISLVGVTAVAPHHQKSRTEHAQDRDHHQQ